jgi:septal ring factor EnvC (AmiA/AmiB activator)
MTTKEAEVIKLAQSFGGAGILSVLLGKIIEWWRNRPVKEQLELSRRQVELAERAEERQQGESTFSQLMQILMQVQSEVKDLRSEVDVLKTERDAAIRQVKVLEGKVTALQRELAGRRHVAT